VATGRHVHFSAYQAAAKLGDDVRIAVSDWESFELWTVGIQLVRAADSIGANIAEALGRRTLADQRRLLVVARGSLLETEHWVERARNRALLPDADSLEARLTELGKMLNGLIRTDPNRR
jgi:four helix bundle protein